jgi:predicted transcriptional regulator
MKNKYRFYSISDNKKETIGILKADTLEEVKQFLAATKHLTVEQIEKLFEIEEIYGAPREQ